MLVLFLLTQPCHLVDQHLLTQSNQGKEEPRLQNNVTNEHPTLRECEEEEVNTSNSDRSWLGTGTLVGHGISTVGGV